jgi:hypothetical protein
VKSDEDGDDRPPIVRPSGMQTRWEPTVASRTITAMAEPRSWDEVAAGLVVDVSLFLCSYAPLFAILAIRFRPAARLRVGMAGHETAPFFAD